MIRRFHLLHHFILPSHLQQPDSPISRIKRCIGERLLTQELASQEGEGTIIANLLNRWNAFGKPVCVKNA
ncbi:hypothetical protein GCT19_40180 [Paraburkholderia sp. CNPSo 3155]|nr:hypothetical protein [Paraburkholderia atlantica]